MKVLDLFAGTRSISKVFEERGHESFSVELDKKHPNIDWYVDILEVSASDILARFGQPDVIWASPPCTTYSIAGISHHRVKDHETGELVARSMYATVSDMIVQHVFKLIEELQPKYYFVENPRGGLRKMLFMQKYPRYTVTYCQYGEARQKPTDIWTNHPNPQFKEPCKQGAPCHPRTPSGSKEGTQGLKNAKLRSIIPRELCEHVAEVCEVGLNERTAILQEA